MRDVFLGVDVRLVLGLVDDSGVWDHLLLSLGLVACDGLRVSVGTWEIREGMGFSTVFFSSTLV